MSFGDVFGEMPALVQLVVLLAAEFGILYMIWNRIKADAEAMKSSQEKMLEHLRDLTKDVKLSVYGARDGVVSAIKDMDRAVREDHAKQLELLSHVKARVNGGHK